MQRLLCFNKREKEEGCVNVMFSNWALFFLRWGCWPLLKGVGLRKEAKRTFSIGARLTGTTEQQSQRCWIRDPETGPQVCALQL